ncbi:unnamed protein product [Durusdinium trenchii]|uniref:Sulfatase N-terminal domain-containing protein n=1 Tax=Durusdinium trenchii TaxID=1381693 RepID=A0ABP0J469_9DINO
MTGYHREDDGDVKTPRIDALARSGIELDRFYSYQFCSPARSAIQTGRNPVHVNVQNVKPECVNSKDQEGGFQGIPINMTGIASLLKRGGYRTHMVGKWDVGMATAAHHPRARGYESWFGYWHHTNDYWQHTEGMCGLKKMRDLWIFNASYDGPAYHLQNGPSCSQENQNPVNETCVFEEALFAEAAKSVIRNHNVAEPLFLFWALHLVHMPLQIPEAYEKKFSFIKEKHRRLMHAMVNFMDDEIGEVVDLLKESIRIYFQWGSIALMPLSTAATCHQDVQAPEENVVKPDANLSTASWPASCRMVHSKGRGSKLEGFVTAWDWYATYAGLAGVDAEDHQAKAAGLPPHDSLDVWPWLSGVTASSPRDEVIVGETSSQTPNGDGQTFVGGVIRGRYKLLVGVDARKWNTLYLTERVSQNVMTGPKWPNSSSHLAPLLHPRKCGRTPEEGCLFDVFADPGEDTSRLGNQRCEFFFILEYRSF